MGGNAAPASTISNPFEVQQALAFARDIEWESLDPRMRDLLASTYERIWERIMLEPRAYILSTDEFAVFNFYQRQWAEKDLGLATAAVTRYWNSKKIDQPDINGLSDATAT